MPKFDKVSRTLNYHAGPPPKTWPDCEDLPPEDGGGADTPADAPKPGGGAGPAGGDGIRPADEHDEPGLATP